VPVLALVLGAHVHVRAVDVEGWGITMGWWNSLFPTRKALDLPLPGIYHFLHQSPENKVRIHLRIEPGGQGSLLINASRIYHLNATAALMAYFILSGYPENVILQTLVAHFRTQVAQVKADLDNFRLHLNALIEPDGICPICDLDLETLPPFSTRSSAPYRMDLALTYRCNNDCAHCYNARPRTYPELETETWKQVIDRLWEIGIPHIVFTGGEPTLRHDLPLLIAHAESRGQITGLNTNGRRLHDPRYMNALCEAGLDHVQITLESYDPTIHDRIVGCPGAWKQTVQGIRIALKTHLFVMTNTTLLSSNAPYLAQTLDFLAELGVPTVGINGLIHSGGGATVNTGIPETQLQDLLALAREKTAHYGQRLIWYTPTRYCHFDPVLNGLGLKGCTAAWYNMCIEPDGFVLPCQSYYQPLGHILNDPWESVWNHDLAVALRERHYVPETCGQCVLLQECGGGCPLTYAVNQAVSPYPGP
jgi:radical SAM protein with 4Fe4S-binding SPASM domain